MNIAEAKCRLSLIKVILEGLDANKRLTMAIDTAIYCMSECEKRSEENNESTET